ncbi:hypothetical protein NNJEOMEG_01655 [Fundidesulfovibrio magnetotacticus]|uniref:Glycosyltransferase RgtA/B/C/D-like domain-containing protein n=1 Tax=Fundidesulfovibrio magnetotacticus TaxID=2730080 RepID=A0A6V8LUN1_9BACT|nr:hypothetical protein [Fundidesulfovibrio magnetotacticus]GFK93819.1 hypothetical protein NNJEOMEG_01655 [Fundidesulfovibrio magnetotacticus]
MHHIARSLAPLLLAVLPAALAWGVVHASFGASLTDFMPHFDLDQFPYWREMASFAAAGFSGGNYGINDTTSVLKGFGPHGVAAPILYGSFYRLLPELGFALIPVVNLGLITLGLGFLLWKERADTGACLLLALGVALYPPVLLFAPSSFQDGLHMAGALPLAWGFIRLMEANAAGKPDRVAALWTGALLLILCFVRYTWAVCLVPYAYAVLSGRPRRLLLAVLAGGAAGLAVVWTFHLFVPVWYASPEAQVFLGGSGGAAAGLWGRAARNLSQLVDVDGNLRASALLSLDLALALVACLGIWLAGWKRTGRAFSIPALHREALLAVSAGLLGLFVMNTVAWVGNGMNMARLLSAHYLFCLPLAVRFLPSRVLHPLVLYGALLLPSSLAYYQYQHYPAYRDAAVRPRVETLRQELSEHLREWKSGNPWDETIALHVSGPDAAAAWLAVPQRYGIQSLTQGTMPVRSRFALLAGDAREKALASPHFKVLKETSVGTLFLRPQTPDSPAGSGG